MASRVSSETVTRLRSASCRSRASRSSGSLTVVRFMYASIPSTALGGTSIEAVVGAPDQPRHGLDEDVEMWLDTGWWVTLRNQFALAPCVANEIILSARSPRYGVFTIIAPRSALGSPSRTATRDFRQDAEYRPSAGPHTYRSPSDRSAGEPRYADSAPLVRRDRQRRVGRSAECRPAAGGR